MGWAESYDETEKEEDEDAKGRSGGQG